eukprot:GHVL01038831.1.p1 GENE.GHVL01038831.1~~GHVL01038831.1.p1  ORF type:complete len:426 (+),score=39.82 GHVL01038831.1:1437-2714(+)
MKFIEVEFLTCFRSNHIVATSGTPTYGMFPEGFVVDLMSKSHLLKIDADIQQSSEVQREMQQYRLLRGGMFRLYFVLKVRREHLLQDTLTQLARATSSDFKKGLRVIFDGEEGVDEGGPLKEFFQLVTQELFDPRYGMWDDHANTTRLFWPRADSFECNVQFELLGTILGLALYNSVILDLHLPEAFYAKLLGKTPNRLRDLTELEPDLAKGLQGLLNFEGDVEETYCRTFTITQDSWGEKTTIDLIEGGSKIAVTNANRHEYVPLYVDYVLNKSVDRAFQAFHRGFNNVCGGPVLSILKPQELLLLLCGSSDLDFNAWESMTTYQDGFTRDSQSIKDFWKVVHDRMSFDSKKKLLFFITGSDRSPLGGLKNLPLTISRNGPDADRLPTSHTCFNHLLLPDYQNIEKLEKYLRIASENSQGFGLQ